MSSNDGSGGLCDARRPFPPILLDACAYINKYESILISRSNIGKKKKTWLDRTINRCLKMYVWIQRIMLYLHEIN